MLIVADSLPYVIMGDWNNPPEELVKTGWLDTIDGYAIAPHNTTCCTSMAKNGTIIDYAVVSSSLTSMVDCIYADEDDPFQPHRSVIMKFHGDVNSISECNASTPTQ